MEEYLNNTSVTLTLEQLKQLTNESLQLGYTICSDDNFGSYMDNKPQNHDQWFAENVLNNPEIIKHV